MKKAAMLLALFFFAQIPLAVVGGAMKEPETVLTFAATKEPVSSEVVTQVTGDEEEVITMATMEQYLANGLSGIVTDLAARLPEEKTETDVDVDADADVGVETEKGEETDVETEVAPKEQGMDKGFAASAEIDTTTPILQKASGTIIQGYVAPSRYKLTAAERDLVERVVMQEVSGRSYVDALAVAQTIYDRSVDWGYTVTYTVNMPNQFANPTYRWEPTAIVKQAVSDVFDKGYRLTEEHMYYYYATRTAKPLSFHETQRCLVETKLHRYFGPWEED